jgi:formate dehydrogenase accessory protein FdhE
MPATSHLAKWDARIARARDLASSRPAARELLTFYATLAQYQRALAHGHGGGGGHGTRSTRRHEDTGAAPVDAVPAFLTWLQRFAPPDLAASVDHLDRHELDRLVASAFRHESEPSHESKSSDESESLENPAAVFVVESILQAFAEQLADQKPAAQSLGTTPMRCPRCAGLPVAAVLREEGHGAKRFLLCSLCLTEWECLRIVCPACGEQEFDTLPVYTAEQFPHVRIDACDRCRHYIKTIDLTKDGLAVPCVDDIASVSLDLWARERGYTRVKRNVLGV